jgi:hypothetical protein
MTDTTDQQNQHNVNVLHVQQQAAQQQRPSIAKIVAAADSRAAESDLVRWMTSGARLLETQRARLHRLRSEYEHGRSRITANYGQQLAELKDKYHDELRRYDVSTASAIEQLQGDVDRLLSMQEAGQWPA